MATLTSTLDAIVGNGTLPTTGNCNISGLNNNGASTITQSTTVAHPTTGTTVTRWTAASAPPGAQVFWDAAKWSATPATTIYGAVDFYLGVANVGLIGILGGITTTSGNQWSIRINNAQQIALYRASTLSGTFTNAVPVGQWVRIEFTVLYDATVGTITASLYSTRTSTTATETLTGSAGSTIAAGTTTPMRMMLGNVGGGTSTTQYYANARWSDVGPLGPASTPYLGDVSVPATFDLAADATVTAAGSSVSIPSAFDLAATATRGATADAPVPSTFGLSTTASRSTSAGATVPTVWALSIAATVTGAGSSVTLSEAFALAVAASRSTLGDTTSTTTFGLSTTATRSTSSTGTLAPAFGMTSSATVGRSAGAPLATSWGLAVAAVVTRVGGRGTASPIDRGEPGALPLARVAGSSSGLARTGSATGAGTRLTPTASPTVRTAPTSGA